MNPHEVVPVLREIEKHFLRYQLLWIYDEAKMEMAEKAVRVGWTFAHSYKSLKKRLVHRPNRPRINELFASKNMKVASEYMGYLRQWGMAIEKALPGMVDVSTWTSEIARLPGGDIHVVSSDPDAFRGMGGDVTLDEFDFHDQQQAIYSTAMSRGDWLPGAQLSIFSSRSPRPSTYFQYLAGEVKSGRMVDIEGQPVFSYHRCTLDDAMRDGLQYKQPGAHLKYLDNPDPAKSSEPSRVKCARAFYEWHRAKSGDEKTFRREYFFETDEQSQLISPTVYDGCVLYHADGGAPVVIPDHLDGEREWGELYVGVDCGRVHDLTVVWVLQRSAKPDEYDRYSYRTVCIKALRNMRFPDQARELKDILTNDWVCKGYIDQGSVGRGLADHFTYIMGSVIQPIGISNKNKAIMCERLRAFAQQQRISFPKDPLVKGDITAMQKTVTLTGTLRYDGSTRDTHCDFYVAAALALHAAEGEVLAARLIESENEEMVA